MRAPVQAKHRVYLQTIKGLQKALLLEVVERGFSRPS